MELEFITTPPDEEPDGIYWYGGAQGYSISNWDDWYRDTRWKFETYLEPTDLRRRLLMKATLHIRGFKSKATGRYRPTHWYLTVAMGRIEQEIAKGKCKSCVGAQRLATRELEPPRITEFLRWAYANCTKVSVYRFKVTKITVMDHVKAETDKYGREGWHDPLTQQLMKRPYNWEPFLTYYEFDYSAYEYFESGFYLWISTDPDGFERVSVFNRSHWSCSNTTDPALKKLVQQLRPWHGSGSSSCLQTHGEATL